MDKLLIEGIGGLGMLAVSVLYSRWQATQNAKEIDELKIKITENETKDNAREVKIAVLEKSLQGLEAEIKVELGAIKTILADLKKDFERLKQ